MLWYCSRIYVIEIFNTTMECHAYLRKVKMIEAESVLLIKLLKFQGYCYFWRYVIFLAVRKIHVSRKVKFSSVYHSASYFNLIFELTVLKVCVLLQKNRVFRKTHSFVEIKVFFDNLDEWLSYVPENVQNMHCVKFIESYGYLKMASLKMKKIIFWNK